MTVNDRRSHLNGKDEAKERRRWRGGTQGRHPYELQRAQQKALVLSAVTEHRSAVPPCPRHVPGLKSVVLGHRKDEEGVVTKAFPKQRTTFVFGVTFFNSY